jgi:hypothetical protein
MVFNIHNEPVAEITRSYRSMIDSLASGSPLVSSPRELVGSAFTRGHFARAV